MKYSFTAEVETADKNIKCSFDADNARDLRGAWQGIRALLFDLTKVGIITNYALEASENTADAWEERGFI